MHWRQREMLFEQTEALKGNLEEKRQPEYTGFGDKSPKMREPDARVASKSGKRRTGGGLQGPGKKRKKRRSFEGAHVNESEGPGPRPAGPGGPRPFPMKRQPDERTRSKKPEDKLAKSRKLGKAKRQDEGKHLKTEKRNARTTNIQAIGSKRVGQRPPDKRLKTSGPKKEGKHLTELDPMYPLPRGAGKTRRKTGTTYQDKRLQTSGPKKEGKHLKELSPMPSFKRPSFLRTKQDSRLKTSRSKKESHCEAYAEAYARGVEAAMNESLLLEFTPIPPFMVEFDMGSLNRLQSAISNGETQFNVGGGYMMPVSLFLNRDGSINTQIVNNLFGANLSEFSDVLGVDVPIVPPTEPPFGGPFPPPGEPVMPLTRDAILNPLSTTRQVTGYARDMRPPRPAGGGSAPFYPGVPGNFSRGGGKVGPM